MGKCHRKMNHPKMSISHSNAVAIKDQIDLLRTKVPYVLAYIKTMGYHPDSIGLGISPMASASDDDLKITDYVYYVSEHCQIPPIEESKEYEYPSQIFIEEIGAEINIFWMRHPKN